MSQRRTQARGGDTLRDIALKYELLNAEIRHRLREIASRMQTLLGTLDTPRDHPDRSRR